MALENYTSLTQRLRTGLRQFRHDWGFMVSYLEYKSLSNLLLLSVSKLLHLNKEFIFLPVFHHDVFPVKEMFCINDQLMTGYFVFVDG